MKLSIVIPAYNEEDAIGVALEQTLAATEGLREQTALSGVEVIVVSDGSTDATEQIARSYEPRARVIAYAENRGYGGALKTGFAAAEGDLIGFLDGDATCDPTCFGPMIVRLLEEDADIRVGSRMGPGSRMPPIRRLGNKLFRWLVNLLASSHISDSASGMRVIRKVSVPRLWPLPDGLHFTPAMTCRALMDGSLKRVEVPISYEERRGRSKLGVVKDGLRFLRTIIEICLSYRPMRFFGALGLPLLLLAVLYGAGLVAFYTRHHAIAEGFFYRMVAVTTFAVVGIQLLMLGLLGERVAAMTRGQKRVRSWLGALIERGAQPIVLLPLATVLSGVAIWANRFTIGEYVTAGRIDVHWSFVVFGAFLVLIACQLAAFVALDYFLSVLRGDVSNESVGSGSRR
jgi:glycosyltransferase involved in cell wall biosynthesis